MRQYTKENTIKALKKVLKEIIIKWYLFSNREARRLWLEDRELKDYLWKYLKAKEKWNIDWRARNNYIFNDRWEKLINYKIKDIILEVVDDEDLDLIKKIICLKKKKK